MSVREMGSIYFKTPAEYKPGTCYTGGSEKRLDEESWARSARSIDVRTGKNVWDVELPSPPWAGVLSTAGGLVFGGSNEGNFYALVSWISWL